MVALREEFFIVFLDGKDQVIDRRGGFPLFPPADYIREYLEALEKGGNKGVSAKIDKRYVLETED
jgi:hypothetical protein